MKAAGDSQPEARSLDPLGPGLQGRWSEAG